jgi:hypothetical protein
MIHHHAERAGSEPAEDTTVSPTILAIPLYGAGGYRARNAHLFVSDASLRWAVDQHRAELVAAGAIGLVAGRMVAFLPCFDEMMVTFAREALGFRLHARQQAVDAAVEAAAALRGRTEEGEQ